MKYHTEDRQVSALTLVAARPKMKKADPNSRTFCKNVNSPPGTPPGSRVFQCQNVSMAQFAERLQNMSPEVNWPVADATGIEGGWDFTLTYTMRAMMMAMGPGPARPAGDAGGAMPSASEPTGGYTLFEALEKQLGLKLERQKRMAPVIVIDHIEQRPTEN
jgi:uncharacterized protein (TIGR03435 family)